ncbi:MAG TPA: hypothetical protein VEX18_21685, partial [Polyangiaceae bacterium]|nr:hypothetical protein [Polyangiaceae bacterium]
MWDANGMIQILPTPDSFYNNDVRGVNYDGSKIVGSSTRLSLDGSSLPSAAALWSDGVWQELVPVPGAFANYAYSIDADGSVVVGTSDEAAIWINGAPAQTIRRLFEDAGHDLTGWHLYEALNVSSDGRVVVGRGSYEGRDQVWI